MGISDNQYNTWLTFAQVIINQYPTPVKLDEDYKMELLHQVLINLTDAKYDLKTVSDNLVFISIRNYFINDIKKRKKDLFSKVEIEYMEDFDNLEDEYNIYKDNEKNLKEETIEIVTNTLNFFDKNLYQLYFIEGLSLRKIGKLLDVDHLVIFREVNKIKDKYHKNYELQKLQKK